MENNQKENLVLIKDLGIMPISLNSIHRKRFGLYKCFCGKQFEATISSVKSKNTKSCGCLKLKSTSNINKTHNLSNHRLFIIRSNMIQRCTNPNNHKYETYGLRGITICDEWKNDFVSFYNWAMNNGYKEGLSIDRINNNGNYEPSNCRWTTSNIQQQNTRKIRINNKSGYRGVSFNKNRNNWRTAISVDSKKIHIGYFKTAIEAAKAYDQYIIDNNLEHTKNF